MGLIFSRIWTSIFKMEPLRVMMVGLDYAGKTTILYQLKLGETLTTFPTVGFNVETFEYKNLTFTVWDMNSQPRMRQLRRHYHHGCKAIIFVVDSNDRSRLAEASQEFNSMHSDDELRDASILVFANKQDQPDALSVAEITKVLSPPANRQLFIQASNALTGDGLYEGFDWLAKDLLSKQRNQ